MNDTNTTMCERCGEDEATTLIEHVLYAEAVCGPCVRDEARQTERDAHRDDMQTMRLMDDDYDRWCQRGE